jgi:hypothetical protein
LILASSVSAAPSPDILTALSDLNAADIVQLRMICKRIELQGVDREDR